MGSERVGGAKAVPERTFGMDRERRDLAPGNVAPKADGARMRAELLAGHAALHEKLRCSPSVAAAIHSGAARGLPAIVSVAEARHVPEGVHVRTWIGATVLTADVDAVTLRSVLDDPLVVSVQVSAPRRRDAD